MNKLTDLEVCKKIADIEGEHITEVECSDGTWLCAEYCEEYNPLTDDALCFRLAKKYRCGIHYYEEWERQGDDNDMLATVEIANSIFARRCDVTKTNNISINRAICLAIIAANEVEL